ncbi:hypothetical protein CDAR_556601 [Caerostris darwini]|uniref:Uncharacterized protein n=1 Tax=Caerostris darwini TaxID=1538125 RepID=A0AAV4WR14_9ARAC|nr:hypothetical protein CDAR_556601 [Caerostris darwini]
MSRLSITSPDRLMRYQRTRGASVFAETPAQRINRHFKNLPFVKAEIKCTIQQKPREVETHFYQQKIIINAAISWLSITSPDRLMRYQRTREASVFAETSAQRWMVVGTLN